MGAPRPALQERSCAGASPGFCASGGGCWAGSAPGVPRVSSVFRPCRSEPQFPLRATGLVTAPASVAAVGIGVDTGRSGRAGPGCVPGGTASPRSRAPSTWGGGTFSGRRVFADAVKRSCRTARARAAAGGRAGRPVGTGTRRQVQGCRQPPEPERREEGPCGPRRRHVRPANCAAGGGLGRGPGGCHPWGPVAVLTRQATAGEAGAGGA